MRKQYEALIEYLEKRAEFQEEYETQHDDAGGNYHFLVKEGFHANCYADKQIRERLEHLEISEHLHEAIVDRVLADGSWEMEPGSIFIPKFADKLVIESFPVGEIEDQVCLDDLRRENNGEFDTPFLRGMMLKAKDDRRLCLRYDGHDCAYSYINTDAVWYAVVDDRTLREFALDAFAKSIEPEVSALLKKLVKDIGDDYRASDDPDDDTPAMRVTIACNDDLAGWSYQTGDNSYTGGCYGSAYWGVGTLCQGDDAKECDRLAAELVSDMLEQIYQSL